jgi:hypothetical protein
MFTSHACQRRQQHHIYSLAHVVTSPSGPLHSWAVPIVLTCFQFSSGCTSRELDGFTTIA